MWREKDRGSNQILSRPSLKSEFPAKAAPPSGIAAFKNGPVAQAHDRAWHVGEGVGSVRAGAAIAGTLMAVSAPTAVVVVGAVAAGYLIATGTAAAAAGGGAMLAAALGHHGFAADFDRFADFASPERQMRAVAESIDNLLSPNTHESRNSRLDKSGSYSFAASGAYGRAADLGGKNYLGVDRTYFGVEAAKLGRPSAAAAQTRDVSQTTNVRSATGRQSPHNTNRGERAAGTGQRNAVGSVSSRASGGPEGHKGTASQSTTSRLHRPTERAVEASRGSSRARRERP